MRTCHPRPSAAVLPRRGRYCHRGILGALVALFVAFVFSLPGSCRAQNVTAEPVASAGYDPSTPPMSQSCDVNYFSQDLGTVLRLRYNTESYGQDGRGNFDLGTMQVISMDDSAAIFDGQVTMNDIDGVGFNLGAGYRWMNFPPYSMDTGRVDGIALFADGTHTDAGNFFPQIGVTYESLGEAWDVRGNLYVPLGAARSGRQVQTHRPDRF